MKKLNILLLPLFLFSCGPDICKNSDYYMSNGICVYENDFSVEESKIEQAIFIAEEETVKRFSKFTFKKIREKYGDTSITFVANDPDNNRAGTMVYTFESLFDYFEIEVELFHECGVYQTLAHEMLHVYRMTVLGPDSKLHPKKWFMKKDSTLEENLSSLEFFVDKRVRLEVCE